MEMKLFQSINVHKTARFGTTLSSAQHIPNHRIMSEIEPKKRAKVRKDRDKPAKKKTSAAGDAGADDAPSSNVAVASTSTGGAERTTTTHKKRVPTTTSGKDGETKRKSKGSRIVRPSKPARKRFFNRHIHQCLCNFSHRNVSIIQQILCFVVALMCWMCLFGVICCWEFCRNFVSLTVGVAVHVNDRFHLPWIIPAH
jgi:hypothetical protein